MEKMLLKMARQLNAMDEASLMGFWEKYTQKVKSFDASRDWEEAALVLSLIEALHLKNQLFNTQWKLHHPEPPHLSHGPSDIFSAEENRWGGPSSIKESKKQKKTGARALIHAFHPRTEK